MPLDGKIEKGSEKYDGFIICKEDIMFPYGLNEYDCNDHWDCGDRDDLELDESFSPLIGEDCGMCQNPCSGSDGTTGTCGGDRSNRGDWSAGSRRSNGSIRSDWSGRVPWEQPDRPVPQGQLEQDWIV